MTTTTLWRELLFHCQKGRVKHEDILIHMSRAGVAEAKHYVRETALAMTFLAQLAGIGMRSWR